MAVVIAGQALDAEPLKELASRTYGIYVVAVGLLPGLLCSGGVDDVDSLTALSETGSMFASDLATAAQVANAHRDVDAVPGSLPQLLRLLANAFSAFAAIQDARDLETLIDILPSQSEADALFDELMSEWVRPGGATPWRRGD